MPTAFPSPLLGIIEGFYGPPWSTPHRLEVMAWCHQRGMNHYVYAPKDDPKHRARWREPYDPDELAGLAALVEAETLSVGFALSPGLSIRYDDPDDLAALAAKVGQVVDLGVATVVLALDDIPPRPGLGSQHATLVCRLREHLDGAIDLVLVPTDYTSVHPNPYLDDLAATCPREVPIAWTGPTVVTDTILVEDAVRRAATLGDRPPLVWDNYPCNDVVMADRLFLGPLRGREAALVGCTSGWLANPMVQPLASRLPLASVAAFLAGDDPTEVWARTADELGWRSLAEACDGNLPLALVDALVDAAGSAGASAARAALRRWLEAVQACGAPGLEEEAAPWLEQAHTEAGVCLLALQALQAADPAAATETMLAAAAVWQAARRSPVSVFGPRAGLRPVLSQDDRGRWCFHAASLQVDANATDRLLAHVAAVCGAAVRGPQPPDAGAP